MRWEALFSPMENTYSGIGSLPVRTTLDGTLYSKKYICWQVKSKSKILQSTSNAEFAFFTNDTPYLSAFDFWNLYFTKFIFGLDFWT